MRPSRPRIEHKDGRSYYCYPRQPIGFARNEGGKVHPVFAKGTHLIRVQVGGRNVLAVRKSTHIERSMRAREVHKRKELPGEAGKNERVRHEIERKYPGELHKILESAQQSYQYHHPGANNAEPYELAEGGYLNEGLESLGLSARFHSSRLTLSEPYKRKHHSEIGDHLEGHLA